MKRNLFLRTDVLPSEIPLMFNNKNVYFPFSEKKMKEEPIKKRINSMITIPYYFYIPKKDGKQRKMSLLHPLAQLQSFSYILRYEQMITAFCSRSPYSVRSPLKRNIPKYNIIKGNKKRKQRIKDEFTLNKNTNITSDEDQHMFLNYFSYKKYKHLSQLYGCRKFNRAKYKYNFFVKLDIQNFFPSIYTHSFSWAIFGSKAMGKTHIGEPYDHLFGNATDKVCQRINFNETNGLVVGPEFARVMAELLLTQIDTLLFNKMVSAHNKHINKDYVIYRFVDDYFVFAKDKNTTEIIENELDTLLGEYNLQMNTAKKEMQQRPFKFYSDSILDLKNALNEFETDKYFAWLNLKNKEESTLGVDLEKFNRNEIRGRQSDWNRLFDKIERIVYTYKDPSSIQRTVNYFLKTIRSSIDYTGGSPFAIMNTLEIIINIYSLNISHVSTNHVITIASKINNKCNKLLQENKVKKSELSSGNTVELEKISKEINNIKTVKNSLFQYLYTTMKNNFNEIEVMYDLLVLFKTFEKPLSSQFLSRIIENFPNSYFILCSVAYYIQNKELQCVNPQYLTVLTKLKSAIYEIKNNYISKGSRNKVLEGEYFYIVNDFSHYPGFTDEERQELKDTIINNYTSLAPHLAPQNTPDSDPNMQAFLFVWQAITRNSYYEWHKKPDDFIKKIILKSIYRYKNSDFDY